jgi:hypothetical protein
LVDKASVGQGHIVALSRQASDPSFATLDLQLTVSALGDFSFGVARYIESRFRNSRDRCHFLPTVFVGLRKLLPTQLSDYSTGRTNFGHCRKCCEM